MDSAEDVLKFEEMVSAVTAKTFKTLQKQYLQKIKYWNIDA
jgi:hypothetical protein